ncbi:MAG: hypothetical protein GX362_05925 [Methanosarcinaceae archaeon]|nr:hypothetical protein [Methanosarcinaceae archaeon]
MPNGKLGRFCPLCKFCVAKFAKRKTKQMMKLIVKNETDDETNRQKRNR